MGKKNKEKFKTLETVFDQFTIRNLFELSSRDFFEEDSLIPVSMGKEANVFAAKKDDDLVIIKIYRLENCDFNSMWEYMKQDPRYVNLKKSRRETVFAWCQREYRNLFLAKKAGVPAPLPFTYLKNLLVMEYVGENHPAPKLKDAVPKKPKEFLDEILHHLRKLYKFGYIHSDLSGFNILNFREHPVLIDFSQAIPINSPNAEEYIRRDCRNLAAFFSKIKVKASEESLFRKITK